MKLTAFDRLFSARVATGTTTLGVSSGSNSGGGDVATGGDVIGSPGSYVVVGLRDVVSLGSNMGDNTLGSVLTTVSSSPWIAKFAMPSNSGPGGSSIYYNVQDYGAVGDDTTDDTSAIQDAIDAAEANGGGTVYFPSTGSAYKITAQLVNGTVALRFLGDGGAAARSGGGSIIRQDSANTNGFRVGNPGGGYPTKFEGLKIEGPTGNSSGAAIFIGDTPQGGDFDLYDVFTEGFYYGAQWGAQSYFSKAYHCRFSGADAAGCYLKTEANNMHFYGCRWDHSPIGVDIIGHLSVGFFGGNFDPYDVTTAQIRANGSATGNNAGLYIAGMYLETDDGVPDILLGNSAEIRQVVVEGCTFVKSAYAGTGWHIDGQNVIGLTVIGNEFMSSDAVRAVGSSAGVVLVNNTNRNSGTYTLPSGSINLDTTNTAATTTSGTTAAAGTSTKVARADHAHALDYGESGDISTQAFGDTAAAGSSDEIARADHRHAMPAEPATASHILLADGHATPFTFNDLLQMDDGSDFMWSDP